MFHGSPIVAESIKLLIAMTFVPGVVCCCGLRSAWAIPLGILILTVVGYYIGHRLGIATAGRATEGGLIFAGIGALIGVLWGLVVAAYF